MNVITIADQRYEFDRAALVAYHASSGEADWNVELVRGGESLFLSGTAALGEPITDLESLLRCRARVDLRSLDEVAGALLGRSVTMYPGGEDVCELAFPLAPSEAGVRLAVSFEFEWDAYLDTFPGRTGRLPASIHLDAPVTIHAGMLPDEA